MSDRLAWREGWMILGKIGCGRELKDIRTTRQNRKKTVVKKQKGENLLFRQKQACLFYGQGLLKDM